ncbi:MAG TPA: transposase [Clostridia bacterium]|nr:transposase [Clostridia bacterium]HPQ47419.1 transposase [Clostridia bacterium]HRX42715.1 transposase [Clostridia bacterium]
MSYKRFLIPYGIYHAYNRGRDRNKIFKSPSDKDVFRKIISESQKDNHFRLLAYSIMGSHDHLIYMDVEMKMPVIIGTIQENYAKYYNAKYNSSGPVFSNPFKSKPITTIDYLFTSISYTLNNPVEAGMVEKFSDYEWNSEILGSSKFNLIDTEYLNYLYKQYSDYPFEKFIEENSTKNLISDIEIYSLHDLEALEVFNGFVKEIAGVDTFNKNYLSPEHLSLIIEKASYAGLSIRQIASFTGLTVSFIKKHRSKKGYL